METRTAEFCTPYCATVNEWRWYLDDYCLRLRPGRVQPGSGWTGVDSGIKGGIKCFSRDVGSGSEGPIMYALMRGSLSRRKRVPPAQTRRFEIKISSNLWLRFLRRQRSDETRVRRGKMRTKGTKE